MEDPLVPVEYLVERTPRVSDKENNTVALRWSVRWLLFSPFFVLRWADCVWYICMDRHKLSEKSCPGFRPTATRDNAKLSWHSFSWTRNMRPSGAPRGCLVLPCHTVSPSLSGIGTLILA